MRALAVIQCIPASIWVESYSIDRAKMPPDSAKLFLVHLSVPEAYAKSCVESWPGWASAAVSVCAHESSNKRAYHSQATLWKNLLSKRPAFPDDVVTCEASCPPPTTTCIRTTYDACSNCTHVCNHTHKSTQLAQQCDCNCCPIHAATGHMQTVLYGVADVHGLQLVTCQLH